MALDSAGLKSAIEGVFDSSPASVGDFADALAGAIIDYLDAVEIEYPKAPGVFPPPAGPGPDPAYNPAAFAGPTTPPSSQHASLKSGIESACAASDPARDWSAADAAFDAVIVAIGAAWAGDDGYTFAGSTVSGGPVGFDGALATGDSPAPGEEGGTTSDIAQAIADAVHTATTASTFTGSYLKASFVGPGPHTVPLS